jgi:ATP-dependent Clp protease adaptor protein ClpS
MKQATAVHSPTGTSPARRPGVVSWLVVRITSLMTETTTTPTTGVETRIERPQLHKVILVNDDYTPREFVVTVLKAEFRINEDQANRVMITAHQRGVCVVAVYTKDVAEAKATTATDRGRSKGYPLLFTTEPEE